MTPWSARQAVILANRGRVNRQRAKELGAVAETVQRDLNTQVEVVLTSPLPWLGALLPAGAVLRCSAGAAVDLVHAREARGDRIEMRNVVAPNAGRFRRS